MLINLQNDFDRKNHELLLKKLEAIGFSDKYLQWLWSYLYEKILFLEIEKQFSDQGKVLCGVHQGFILGLLLFLIYVNDMPQAVKSNLFLYLNDLYLMHQHRDLEEIKELN